MQEARQLTENQQQDVFVVRPTTVDLEVRMIFNGYLGYARLKNDFKPIIAGQFQQVINEIMADGLYIGKSFVKNGYVWSLESTPESPGMAKLIGKIERIRIDH